MLYPFSPTFPLDTGARNADWSCLCRFCACTNNLEPLETLGTSSCNFTCQAPFQSESCGGSTEDGDPIYNVFSILRVDNSTGTPSNTTTATLPTELPPSATSVPSSSNPTAITNTTSTGSPPLVTDDGANRGASVSVVTQTTTLPTCPTCTKNGAPTPTPTPAAVGIAPDCPPGGLCIFINIYFITTVVQAPDGLGLVTTATPTRSTVYYDPAQSTVTTVVEMGRTRVVLVPVTRVATVSVAGNYSSSSSVAAAADDVLPPLMTVTNTAGDSSQTGTAAAADLLPPAVASSSPDDGSSLPASSSSSSPSSTASWTPPSVVIQMANVTATTAAAPSATTDVNGTVLNVTRLPDPVVAGAATAAVPSDRLLVLSWLGVLAGGAFLLL